MFNGLIIIVFAILFRGRNPKELKITKSSNYEQFYK